MNAITPVQETSIALEQAEPMINSLPVLRGQYPRSQTEADEARAAATALSIPANPVWVAQRAVKCLSGHYFVAEMADAISEQAGKDWVRELQDFPEWAIDEAFSWWIGRENKDRRKKPLPGDIATRAQRNMQDILFARQLVRMYRQYRDTPPHWIK